MEGKQRLYRTARLVILFLPLLAGTFLRFARLGHQSLFLDEAFTANLALRPWREMLDMILTDVHPPLFYFMLKPIITFLPLTEWTVRSLSAFCSVVALALAMGLARRLGGNNTAFITGWVLSWSALHLYYAQDARMYALLDVWWVLAAIASLYALRDGRKWAWFVWSGAVLAAIYTHFYGFVLWGVGACGGWALILFRRKWRDLRWWAVSQALVLFGTLPLLSFLVRVVSKWLVGAWVPSWREPLDLLALMLFGFTTVREYFLNGYLLALYPWNFSRTTGELMLVIPVGLALLGWIWSRRKSQWLGWLVRVYGLLPLCVVTFLLWAGSKRLWAYKPFIGVATLVAIGLASGWRVLPSWLWRVLLVALFVLNLGSLYSYEFRWVKDYGRDAFRSLPEHSALLLDRHYTAHIFYFYRPDWEGNLFGLVPRASAPYELARMTKVGLPIGPVGGSLGGHIKEIVDCEELPAQIALYDPTGRRFSEGDSWPSCLRERSGWIFNPETGVWEEAVPLLYP